MKPVVKQKTEQYAQPLATRMRPQQLNDYIGQSHLVGIGKPLRRAIEDGLLHSMILWGPPGTGKTTLAQLMAERADARFVRLSAIFSGVKDIRKVVEEAKAAYTLGQQSTILFIDEIHRFNKAQQDVFLPFVEDGTFILIGATTENPSFELNGALLSRCRVYVLKSLSEGELNELIDAAIHNTENGLGCLKFDFSDELRSMLIQAADGDARQVLNLLEIIADLGEESGKVTVTRELLSEVLQASLRRFDNQGEAFYDQMSALHKSVRGSHPDASLYWLCRMLDGGCDPRYIARRVIRMACEDIGLADPKALTLALNAAETYERLGSPEGELALAEAVTYLACVPKSNAVYTAFHDAMAAVKKHGSLDVPMHIRNAPTKLMSELGYGKSYRYAHDEEGGYAAGESYLPDKLKNVQFYAPVNRGLEAKIADRLSYLRDLDKKRSLRKP